MGRKSRKLQLFLPPALLLLLLVQVQGKSLQRNLGTCNVVVHDAEDQQVHERVYNCTGVTVQGLTIAAPASSPNTDGVHAQLSSDVGIFNATIRTGDDCVSLGPGTSNGEAATTVQNGVRIKSSDRPSGGFVTAVATTSITVGKASNVDYKNIQDAIDAVPANTGRAVITVLPGTYREKIVIKKSNLTVIGAGARSTVITWNETGMEYGGPTVSVLASDFVAKGLTFENAHGEDKQAIAIRVSGDRVAFYQCSFRSFQDTILDDVGRHYYHECYIEGGMDFICGNGKSLFEKCHLHSLSRNGGAFTSQKRMAQSEDTGYSFVRCSLTGVGVGTSILGRPWGPYSRVVFALSFISNTLKPEGWND